MKSKLIIKLAVVLPLIIFVDYIVMSALGCISCFFGAGENYFCGIYCIIGKILAVFSIVFFLYLIFPEIKSLIVKKHVKTV
jgi:hypothetical protein